MAEPESDTLLSVAQAASLLGVHPNTIRAWTDAGRLTAYRINSRGDRRFRRGDVVRLLVEDGVATDDADAVAEIAPAHTELGVFSRIATGLAATPTPASVARVLVEAIRTDLRAERVAVYTTTDDHAELAAHAGFAGPPPLTLDPALDADDDGPDAVVTLSTRRGPVGT